MSPQTVPIQFVHRLLTTAQRRGVDVMSLLRDARVPPDIVYNPQARVTAEQMTAVTHSLWRATDDELFGLGPPVPNGTYRLIALAIIHAPDLRAVLARLNDLTKVLPGVPTFGVQIGVETTSVEMDVSRLDDPDHVVTELLLAFVHRSLGWMIGRRIALLSVELPYPAPRFAASYEAIYGCTPTFDAQRVASTFDSVLLEAPVMRTEEELARYLEESPYDFYATRDYGTTTADRVRKLLERGLDGEWPTADDIAAKLAVSTGHLRRWLREQDTSVSQIREQILRDAAIASLSRGEESVSDLAGRLGFSEPSAFRRAFRRWTGSAPGTYRLGSGLGTKEHDG